MMRIYLPFLISPPQFCYGILAPEFEGEYEYTRKGRPGTAPRTPVSDFDLEFVL